MWRPEDWQNPYQAQLDSTSSGTGIEGRQGNILKGASDVYEAGADAMLGVILPLIEKEVRAHTSGVSTDAIICGQLWSEMAKQ